MQSLRWQFLVTCVVIFSIVLVPVAAAQSEGVGVYFPQTGHTVKDPFLAFFNDHDGVVRFGYPITVAYTDPATGMYIQYFQRARFELHPENPERYRVQLGLLSDELGKRQPPIPVSKVPSTSDPSCHYFDVTGHLACHKFLKYWIDNGGLDVFGYPISGYVMENNRIVQYFQRARFEWHPEKPDGQRVQLAPLGEIYFEKMAVDPKWRDHGGSAVGPISVIALHARGNVADAVVARGSTETAYVTVTDQLNNPVAGVKVTMIVHLPSGDQYYALPATDGKGTTSHTFPAGKYTPGTVISIEFNAAYGTLTTTTRTSYLMWFY